MGDAASISSGGSTLRRAATTRLRSRPWRRYAALRFDFSRRREKLSWSHYARLAALEKSAQDRWLDEAERERSVRFAASAARYVRRAGPSSRRGRSRFQ